MSQSRGPRWSRVASLPRAILDPAEYRSAHPNILIYGESGVGKTPWIMQLPRLLVLAVDPEGTISARTWGKGTKVWPIRRWEDFVAAMEFIEANPTVFKYVLVDTIGSLQYRLLRSILEAANKANPAKYDRDIPQIQDHQRWQNMLKRVVMDLNDLPITVIWTAQEMLREDAEGDEMTLPLLPGGKNQYEVAMWVTSIMHIVGRMGAKSTQLKNDRIRVDRGIVFKKRPPYVARDRTGTLPDSMLIASGDRVVVPFAEIIRIIEAGGDAAMARAEALVDIRDDDPDEIIEVVGVEGKASNAYGSVPDGDGDETTEPELSGDPAEIYAENAAREDAERDSDFNAARRAAKKAPAKKASPAKATAKAAKATKTTGRKFQPADEEE